MTHYKGVYRLRTEYDKRTKTFPREYTGQFAERDVYIDCRNNIRIYHYGNRILEAYRPSIGRGRNIIKSIQNEIGMDIIYHIEETDSEILFRFNSKYMKDLEKYLKPKTNGSSISPFSNKNLPRNKEYKIPDEQFAMYKNIVDKIPSERALSINHSTRNFINSLVTKKNPIENIKADMALKGLKGKEYIHSINKWDEYITYLKQNLNV